MTIQFTRGDIVIVDLQGSLGFETNNGEKLNARPCLVVQNDRGNSVSPMTIIAPITDMSQNRNLPVQVVLTAADRGPLIKDSVVQCGQLRTVDRAKRITKIIGRLPPEVMSRVDAALAASLSL